MPKETTKDANTIPKNIQEMFSAGAHFGFSKSRRHPSFKPFIFGQKNSTEILNLEKTEELFVKAMEYVKMLGKGKKMILFASSKSEAKGIVKNAAESIDMPFVFGRWIGGTLTNYDQIKKRVAKLGDLNDKKEKGELTKYTKKERLLIDREIDNLERYFGGIRSLSRLPDALFVVDSKREHTAVEEARKMKVPVIALSSTDSDLALVDHPIPGNASSKQSIEYFVNKIVEAYKEGGSTQ